MIDWTQAKPKDFELRIEGEGIQESGNHIIFPVHVYHKTGVFAFLKSIPIRSEFYTVLKKNVDWKKALIKIFQQRVRDEIQARIELPLISLEDKIEFVNLDKQSL